MASEISQTLSLTALSGDYSASAQMSKSRDQASKRKFDATLSIGTAEEIITFGDLTTPRFVQITNLDPANYVRLGPDSTTMVPFIRLLAGDTCQLPLEPGVSVKAQANVAPVMIGLLALDA